ncbi:autotransporter outer membrane beta-barrel domain-containing protein [Sulfurospirillum barnesii]|uniref:Outer membrane autotransporter barrel domain-containing protein n=1 Tax=Sulfurospirillum barnesii (strain ATCC 700032 / DSM 10660 / SES-3) TaxID=760154 RepID=I3XXI2_SULBS|nr:autotransporter outer membrane beta-barrel domain-containing protein [Sulfurospirillum barnesii]AFL68656.1 outer membrane autotransporter barrel domain-containing protein [Sulfurospirillum barnesii SES-3]
MNTIYRTIYNATKGLWITIREISRLFLSTKKRNFSSSIAKSIALLGLSTTTSWSVCGLQFDGTYLCSAITNSPVNIAGNDLHVKADGTFQYASAEPMTITENSGSIQFKQEDGSSIRGTAQYGALKIFNNGFGSSTIETAGDIINTNGYGSLMWNNAMTTTDLTFTQTAGTITGATAGIFFQNYGTGATTIQTAGDIVGTSLNGLSVVNETKATDLIFNQIGGSITGGAGGVHLSNLGTGKTTIVTAGDITGNGAMYRGLFAESVAGTDLLFKQVSGTITGATGVYISKSGTGSSTIETAGDIIGTSVSGILAINRTRDTTADLILNQVGGNITGVKNGIELLNAGAGKTSVQIAGNVEGTTENGLYIDHNVFASDLSFTQTGGSITGGTSGAYLTNVGTGKTTIVTAGDITGTHTGLYAENLETATDLIFNQVGGNITGVENGIELRNAGAGKTSVQIAGNVEGTTGTGLNIYHNVFASDLSFTQTGGSITGFLLGAYFSNGGTGKTTIITAGDITATHTALYAENLETATDFVFKQVSGTITGSTGATIINIGIGSTTIETEGDIVGTELNGILAINDANAADLIFNQTGGSITGVASGVNLSNRSIGNTIITTAGDITGTEIGLYAENLETATDLIFNQAGGHITGEEDGVWLINNSGTDTVAQISGVITGGMGAGLHIGGSAESTLINVLNQGVISSTSGIAIQDDSTANYTVLNLHEGSKVMGDILMGKGSDTVVIHGGADISGVTLFDGGNPLSSDDTNTLVFARTTQEIAGERIVNFDTIVLDDSTVTLSGEKNYGLFLMNNSLLQVTDTLDISGNVSIDETSVVSYVYGGRIVGNVTNGGGIFWERLGETFTIHGNYEGIAGSISLETILGDDSSITDKLHVTGNITGTTAIDIRPIAGGLGAQTVEGINIVVVDGTSASDSFVLAHAVQAGAYEYILKQGSSYDANDWYLISQFDCTLNNSCSPAGTLPIYRPGVINYMGAQSVNKKQGLLQLSTFHNRMGEKVVSDEQDRLTWLKPYYMQYKAKGETRFGYDSKLFGVQLGQEIFADENIATGLTHRAAITLDYAKSNTDFNDRLRPLENLDADTGSMNAKSLAIGGTYTIMNEQRGYIDFVGQLSSLTNDFSDSHGDKSTQKGKRVSLSVEAGQPIAAIGNWSVEPQVQLSYMHTDYDAFHDLTSHIKGYNTDALRGRLGTRIATKEISPSVPSKYYASVNLLHDFDKPETLVFDGTSIKEDFSRTHLEAGLGMNYQIAKNTFLHADIAYQHSLDGEKSQGVITNIALKVKF